MNGTPHPDDPTARLGDPTRHDPAADASPRRAAAQASAARDPSPRQAAADDAARASAARERSPRQAAAADDAARASAARERSPRQAAADDAAQASAARRSPGASAADLSAGASAARASAARRSPGDAVADPSTPDPSALAEERLVAALRERGQRVTSQRLVIGRLLREIDRHVTAEEVLRRASEQLPGVSLPTVYATLDLLTELGEARRVAVGGPVLYDPRTEDHAHLRCRVCGTVSDLDIPLDTTVALRAARAAGFAPDTAELVVEGRCAECAAAA